MNTHSPLKSWTRIHLLKSSLSYQMSSQAMLEGLLTFGSTGMRSPSKFHITLSRNWLRSNTAPIPMLIFLFISAPMMEALGIA